MADETINAFTQLALERRRTGFTFYGFRMADGKPGGAYHKLAHSLSEAVADLEANAGIADEGGYLVRDAFLEEDDDGGDLHVELVSIAQIVEDADGGER
jgi:hypothetical protein